jgi:hypothetical protein
MSVFIDEVEAMAASIRHLLAGSTAIEMLHDDIITQDGSPLDYEKAHKRF